MSALYRVRACADTIAVGVACVAVVALAYVLSYQVTEWAWSKFAGWLA